MEIFLVFDLLVLSVVLKSINKESEKMKSRKNICLITIILLVIFSIVGCSLIPSTTQPKGTISGQVLIPPNAAELSKDITGWVPVAGAELTIVDASGVTHTVTTDENGYYSFENIAVNPNTVITATATVDGNKVVLKNVIPLAVAAEQDYDAGEMTPESTALALVVEALIVSGDAQADIDLEEITSGNNFSTLLGKVTTVLEAGGDVTGDADVVDTVNDIINPPTPTPVTPTPSTPTVTYYSITSLAGDGGTISPLGETTVTEGDDQTFTITSDEGYKISDVLVDGLSEGTVTTYTFTDIQADHTIAASFDCLTPESVNINIDSTDGKVCVGSCVTVETVTVSFSDASEELVISNLEDERLDWVVPNDVTFTKSTGELCTPIDAISGTTYKLEVTYTDKCGNPAMKGEVSVTVEDCYNITLNADPVAGGTVSDLTDAGPYLSGTEVSISAVPNSGYAFANWTTTSSGTFVNANSASTTFTMPAGNAEVTANFKSILFSEDFTGLSYGEIPENWTKSSNKWVGVVDENNAGGTAPEIVYVGSSSTSSVTDRLVSPSIDATGNSGLNLIFKYFVSHISYTYQLKVQVSTNNGSTWTTEATYSIDNQYYDMTATVAEVNLSDYDGNEFQVAWVFQGSPDGIITWKIDDIVILKD